MSSKFGLPHDVVAYLNGGNGYTNNVNGLFQLANDVLGGAIHRVNPLNVQYAVAAINNAFDGCRILTGTITLWSKYSDDHKYYQETENNLIKPCQEIIGFCIPNPYDKHFNSKYRLPVSGMA